MIDPSNRLPVTRQCELLALSRSTFYYQPSPVSSEDLELMRRIDEMHLERPFYGSRRIRDWRQDEGHGVNRKRVQRLMRQMGIMAVYPKPRTSRAGGRPQVLFLPAQGYDGTPAQLGLGSRHYILCAQPLEASRTTLPGLEHVWNAFRFSQG